MAALGCKRFAGAKADCSQADPADTYSSSTGEPNVSDRILGGFGLLLALTFVWRATLIEQSPFSDIVGPRVFPLIICTVMALCSLYFIVKPDTDPAWPAVGRLFEILMAVVVMVLYAELLPVLGFLVATALASAYLTWRLGTKPLPSVIVGVLIAVGIYIVFKLILGLSLAEGPLGF